MRSNLLTTIILVLCITSTSYAGWGHNALVRASGIRPMSGGSHEGVGMSTRSYSDAVHNACYWGRRTPISIQYSKRGNQYYAVVRYR